MEDKRITESDNSSVLAFYTLSSTSIAREILESTPYIKRLGKYRDIPATLIGRLAVDSRSKGAGFGRFMLFDALERGKNLSKNIGSLAIVVDPKDESAAAFYEHYGFISIEDGSRMFMVMKEIG